MFYDVFLIYCNVNQASQLYLRSNVDFQTTLFCIRKCQTVHVHVWLGLCAWLVSRPAYVIGPERGLFASRPLDDIVEIWQVRILGDLDYGFPLASRSLPIYVTSMYLSIINLLFHTNPISFILHVSKSVLPVNPVLQTEYSWSAASHMQQRLYCCVRNC